MIDKITPQQESEIAVYLKKWLDVGYRTETTDPVKATKFIEFLYKNLLKIETPEIHFVKSPLEAQILCNKLVNGIDSGSNQKLEYFEPSRGNWWLSYYSYGDYLLNVLFPEKKPEFTLLEEFLENSKHCHFSWTFDTFAIVCDFPDNISINSENQLQDNLKAALSYRDGYGVFALDSKTMSKEEWEAKTIQFKSTLGSEIFKKI